MTRTSEQMPALEGLSEVSQGLRRTEKELKNLGQGQEEFLLEPFGPWGL